MYLFLSNIRSAQNKLINSRFRLLFLFLINSYFFEWCLILMYYVQMIQFHLYQVEIQLTCIQKPVQLYTFLLVSSQAQSRIANTTNQAITDRSSLLNSSYLLRLMDRSFGLRRKLTHWKDVIFTCVTSTLLVSIISVR